MIVTIYPNELYTPSAQGTLRTSTPNNLPSDAVAPTPPYSIASLDKNPPNTPSITPNTTAIGSTTYSAIWPTTSAIYADSGKGDGIPGLFNLSDLPAMQGETPTVALTQVSTDSYSTYQELGARGVQIVVEFQNPNGQCDIKLYTNINATNIPVKSWADVTVNDTPGLYCGHADGINLQGNILVVEALNITNGWVTVGLTPIS